MELGGIILPPELERAVFEAAAFLDYKNISRLMLVAHRAHEWLEPLLYYVLVCEGAIPHRLQAALDEASPRSTELVECHVRHLFFTIEFPHVERTLHVCSGATDLAFFTIVMPSFIPHLDRIRPLRLCVDIRALFAGSPDFSRSMFNRLTHLNVFGFIIPDSLKGLASLSCLTHLAFNCEAEELHGDFFHEVLAEFKLLRALVILLRADDFEHDDALATTLPTRDARFVISRRPNFSVDWVKGAWGSDDFWVKADKFIRLRRGGDIPKELCCMS